MVKAAIIVESPTKTRTLKRFLGEEFELLASMGHVRDLPEDELAVDVEHGFQPSYTTTPRQAKQLASLKKALKKVDKVYLASDPDREGEAIAWHLAEALELKDAERIEFNEITESAVREALEHPRTVDINRVNAQQARRILDRLVGYLISPLLWEKIGGRGRGAGLSAGRVQSAALKLICAREREIAAFNPVEYWTIGATLTPFEIEFPFDADLRTHNGEDIDLTQAEQALPIADELRELPYIVKSVQRRERRRNPQAPFITSTLQRAAANTIGFSARKTMLVAQQLYEGIEMAEGPVGLITYMRTDSTRIAQQARETAVEFIKENFGEELVGPGVSGKKVKGAQEAHEAIRPNYVERTPESLRPFLDDDQYKLYDLIWRRFVSSQMSAAVMDQTTVDINAGPWGLRATGSVIKFKGFLTVTAPTDDDDEEKERTLPALQEGQDLKLVDVKADQHFTKPPPRYSEATLVRELEENGVGRPSTYAQIIETLRNRKYVSMEKRNFLPTALGFVVNDYLVDNFPEIIDVDFTARMEGLLDEIENGEVEWGQVLSDFHGPFILHLQTAKDKEPKLLEEVCPECGGKMYERYSIYGKFAGCENYPECKHTRDLMGDLVKKPEKQELEEECPECGAKLVLRQGRWGKSFIGCGAYPKCKYLRPAEGDNQPARPKAIETDIECEKCSKPLMVRFGRRGPFLGCSGYPRCRTTRNLTDVERAQWVPDMPAEDFETNTVEGQDAGNTQDAPKKKVTAAVKEKKAATTVKKKKATSTATKKKAAPKAKKEAPAVAVDDAETTETADE